MQIQKSNIIREFITKTNSFLAEKCFSKCFKFGLTTLLALC